MGGFFGGSSSVRLAAPAPRVADTDLTGNAAIAAQQRSQFQLLARNGMRANLLTSTRGTEGLAGAGLAGASPGGAIAAPPVGSGTVSTADGDAVVAGNAASRAASAEAGRQEEARRKAAEEVAARMAPDAPLPGREVKDPVPNEGGVPETPAQRARRLAAARMGTLIGDGP